jgi:clan AA aspartic protease
MMTGHVNAYRQAVVSLVVRGPANVGREIDAVVDTGFNGFLTLPASLIQELGLVWRRRGRAMLADGSDSLFDIYEGTVAWDNTWRRTAVDEAECDPLVGMSLLDGYQLSIQVTADGRVVISPLPGPA